jgi:hypothetical protein
VCARGLFFESFKRQQYLPALALVGKEDPERLSTNRSPHFVNVTPQVPSLRQTDLRDSSHCAKQLGFLGFGSFLKELAYGAPPGSCCVEAPPQTTICCFHP